MIRVNSWLFAGIVWAVSFGAVAGLQSYLAARRQAGSGRVDWLFVSVLATALTVAVVSVVRRLRSQPSAAQQAALGALLDAEPGKLGAVVVMRNGVPEVIATVRSREEYLVLLQSGQLPEDHSLYLTEDA